MAKKNRTSTMQPIIDCACVIHGAVYEWTYVEKLYNMLQRNIPQGIRFHVYTEHDRSVPPYMIKHILDDWGIVGPKKSWWYKLQLFNPDHFSGNLFYLDLDTIITGELSWIFSNPTDIFWTIRDFKYLQSHTANSMNSSVMWFNVEKFADVYRNFKPQDLSNVTRQFAGDQDYLQVVIDHNRRRFLDITRFMSFRWESWRGGMNWRTREHNNPSAGIAIKPETSILVFHGKPKPHEVTTDPVVQQFWR